MAPNVHIPSDPAAAARAARTLPLPDADAAAHSARLVAAVRAAIAAAGGPIPFDRYMELALYAPGLGYYSAGSRKLGADGDFVTAPEISPLFSRALAAQCAEILMELGDGSILELGAGSGAMAAELLAALERRGCLPREYLILEVSADLAERQRQALAQRVPHLLARVRWLERLPAAPLRAVVLANEVLDAMPVTRFRVVADAVAELCVGWDGERFVETTAPPASARTAERLERLARQYELPPGYESEVNLRAEDWIRALAPCVEAGAALLIDYGFPGREYYHPQRASGTLMCHYRHRAHPDPYWYPGLQDLTAHVDFTAMAHAAAGAGWQVAGFANQASFLLGCGLLELMQEDEEAGGLRGRLDRSAQVKRLTLPSEMGELFKVLALTRGLTRRLRGFALRDDRGRL